jgi:aminoglycoside phosphotransferase (APT) family kinase protein
MHVDQLSISEKTVRRLVHAQYPQWADRSVLRVATAGTVNAIFRVGEDLAARFPLQPMELDVARETLRREAVAARKLAEASPVPAPVPVALGEPGFGYPLPWSVQTWLPGRDAVAEDPGWSSAFARDLAAFITALRRADTEGRRFAGSGRGGHLPDHDDWVAVCLRRSAGLIDAARARALWAELRELPEVDADVMCHGDLTPPNVLVRDGRLTGVLDGGGFAPADPALDLISAWHLLEAGPREVLRETLGCSSIQWRRGMAWALEQAMGLVWYYADSNPVMSRVGRRTLGRVFAA